VQCGGTTCTISKIVCDEATASCSIKGNIIIFRSGKRQKAKEKLSLALAEIESDKANATSIEIGQPIRKLVPDGI
jgi:hypothetical protein